MARIKAHRAFNAAAAGSNQTQSPATIIPDIDLMSYVVKFVRASGTLAGTLKLEVSNSGEDDIAGGTDIWVTYDSLVLLNPPAGATIAAGVISISTGGTVTFPVELKDIGFRRHHWVWTASTGTGTLTIEMNGKGRG